VLERAATKPKKEPLPLTHGKQRVNPVTQNAARTHPSPCKKNATEQRVTLQKQPPPNAQVTPTSPLDYDTDDDNDNEQPEKAKIPSTKKDNTYWIFYPPSNSTGRTTSKRKLSHVSYIL
jgi:hypothetical protein